MKEDTGKTNAKRKPHAQAFKDEALGLAERVGVPIAAKELGLHSSQLYGWRSKARGQANQSDVERAQATEIARLKRQLADQAEELAIVKKAAVDSICQCNILRQGPDVKHVFMDDNQALFKITAMSRVFQVSRSGFYRWRKRLRNPSVRQVCRLTLDRQVKLAFDAGKGRNGAPRLVLDLEDADHHYDRKTVANSMRRQGLRAKAARKFKATTNSAHSLPVAPNLLRQDFVATAPNQKYVTDITYLWTDEGWLYLAIVIDLYSRLVVGWAMSNRMTAQLVCDALQMGLWRRHMPTGVIVHSDRGSQYCYQALLQANGLLCSTSARGNCYDCEDSSVGKFSYLRCYPSSLTQVA